MYNILVGSRLRLPTRERKALVTKRLREGFRRQIRHSTRPKGQKRRRIRSRRAALETLVASRLCQGLRRQVRRRTGEKRQERTRIRSTGRVGRYQLSEG